MWFGLLTVLKIVEFVIFLIISGKNTNSLSSLSVKIEVIKLIRKSFS